MNQSPTSIDNYKSRVARIFVDNREFTDDNGKKITYQRLVLQVLVKGDPFNIEFKPESKDLAILKLADIVENGTITDAGQAQPFAG